MARQLTAGDLKKLLILVPDDVKLYSGFRGGEARVNCLSHTEDGIVFVNAYHTDENDPLIWTLQTVAKFSKNELNKEDIKRQINFLIDLL